MGQTWFGLAVIALIPLTSACESSSDPGTSPAGAEVSLERVEGLSLQIASSAPSSIAQGFLDRMGIEAGFSGSALRSASEPPAIECPDALEGNESCEAGALALAVKSCAIEPKFFSSFVASDLEGEFQGCSADGIALDGGYAAAFELNLSTYCLSDSLEERCLESTLTVKNLTGDLEIRDEEGILWTARILSESFFAEWTEEGTRFFRLLRGRVIGAEIDLRMKDGPWFRCVLLDGVADCRLDSDKDGLADAEDACPTVPAGLLDEAGDGCPDVADDTDPLCKVKPTCSDTTDCDHFLDVCTGVAEAAGDRETYPPLGLGIYCNHLDGANQCELFRRIVAPFGECPPDTPPPPDVPPGPECRPGCVTDEDCEQPPPTCEGCTPIICHEGCCTSGGDFDHDGVIDAVDNCHSVPNENQANCDGDRFGDVCDTCPANFEINANDFDRDTVGDACETGSECGNGFCEIEENLVTCSEDCGPDGGLRVCEPAFSDVTDCRERYVELGQSPIYPFDNPLTPQFLHAIYNQTELLNCCESIGCGSPENCGPGSYCDTAGYCALIPCSGDTECGGSTCLPDGWCDVSCGNGVCNEGETTLNCSHDCVDRPPPPPPPP